MEDREGLLKEYKTLRSPQMQYLQAVYAFNAIQSTVEELHSINYVHCDICLSNCIVDAEGVVSLED
jgi:serine/threonine protein kinase